MHVTFHNFTDLLRNHVADTSGGSLDAPYVHWIINSMIVAGATAVMTTMLGALAAYAFSRFRFKGRRMGMMSLLLIQMFPQFARDRRDLPARLQPREHLQRDRAELARSR